MVHLEQVFMKNVILYLETMKDVFNFMFINKSSLTAVQTMYINTYKASMTSSIEDILRFFPKLQTLYFSSFSNNLKKLSSNDIPLIEVGTNTNPKTLINTLKTKWFPPKVRTLRIQSQQIEAIAKNIDQYEQLQFLIIDYSSIINPLTMLKVVSLNTLKKVYIYGNSDAISQFNEFDFKKHYKTTYVFVMAFSMFLFQQPNLENFKRCPPNVQIYVQYISKETECWDYIPQFCNNNEIFGGRYVYPIYIISDSTTSSQLIADVMNKTLHEILTICVPKINNFVNYQPQEINWKVNEVPKIIDLINLDLIKEITLTNALFDSLVFPRKIEKVDIQNVSGNIEMKECKPIKFSIVNYTGNQLIFNDERLQYFACQDCANKVSVLHNNKLYNNKFFLDVQKYTNFNVVQIDMPQIVVFEKNTEVLFEAKMGSLAYTPLFLSILKLENDIILPNFSYEIFDFNVTIQT
ncbi:hypothetical protein EIN_078720 [Entamoeba invadens IP1]|uniref:Uncharacterized protein n=1 Tax=Entamoeba invadens IP1 TaxID=370355 RepID=L7FP23_ENTIV|nr:hypothetical protein EIN_078720 [Entamoeba invadens IP1]ELP92944.1 hypothetical protein EIN_078720 [Entamoeba invadens IP1]|eukprot:XP_004259715.1 hypothetical protein EIN_078720 [Entamoeba invadens IP1]